MKKDSYTGSMAGTRSQTNYSMNTGGIKATGEYSSDAKRHYDQDNEYAMEPMSDGSMNYLASQHRKHGADNKKIKRTKIQEY